MSERYQNAIGESEEFFALGTNCFGESEARAIEKEGIQERLRQTKPCNQEKMEHSFKDEQDGANRHKS